MEAIWPPNGEIMKDDSNPGFWSRLWVPIKSKWLLGIPIGGLIAFVVGIIAVGAFNQAMHFTNVNQFCYGCHIGMDTIVEEYEQSVHFNNNKGIQASCSDCHVPKEFLPKMLVKIKATKDIYHMLAGTITLDNFEEKRNELAETVWQSMQARNSQECKTCHDPDQWNLSLQPLRAQIKHNQDNWLKESESCIDCHQGIAHNRPVVR